MIADHAYGRILQRHDPSGRRLRNRIIMANAIAWIVVIALIRLILFQDEPTVPTKASRTPLSFDRKTVP